MIDDEYSSLHSISTNTLELLQTYSVNTESSLINYNRRVQHLLDDIYKDKKAKEMLLDRYGEKIFDLELAKWISAFIADFNKFLRTKRDDLNHLLITFLKSKRLLDKFLRKDQERAEKLNRSLKHSKTDIYKKESPYPIDYVDFNKVKRTSRTSEDYVYPETDRNYGKDSSRSIFDELNRETEKIDELKALEEEQNYFSFNNRENHSASPLVNPDRVEEIQFGAESTQNFYEIDSSDLSSRKIDKSSIKLDLGEIGIKNLKNKKIDKNSEEVLFPVSGSYSSEDILIEEASEDLFSFDSEMKNSIRKKDTPIGTLRDENDKNKIYKGNTDEKNFGDLKSQTYAFKKKISLENYNKEPLNRKHTVTTQNSDSKVINNFNNEKEVESESIDLKNVIEEEKDSFKRDQDPNKNSSTTEQPENPKISSKNYLEQNKKNEKIEEFDKNELIKVIRNKPRISLKQINNPRFSIRYNNAKPILEEEPDEANLLPKIVVTLVEGFSQPTIEEEDEDAEKPEPLIEDADYKKKYKFANEVRVVKCVAKILKTKERIEEAKKNSQEEKETNSEINKNEKEIAKIEESKPDYSKEKTTPSSNYKDPVNTNKRESKYEYNSEKNYQKEYPKNYKNDYYKEEEKSIYSKKKETDPYSTKDKKKISNYNDYDYANRRKNQEGRFSVQQNPISNFQNRNYKRFETSEKIYTPSNHKYSDFDQDTEKESLNFDSQRDTLFDSQTDTHQDTHRFVQKNIDLGNTVEARRDSYRKNFSSVDQPHSFTKKNQKTKIVEIEETKNSTGRKRKDSKSIERKIEEKLPGFQTSAKKEEIMSNYYKIKKEFEEALSRNRSKDFTTPENFKNEKDASRQSVAETSNIESYRTRTQSYDANVRSITDSQDISSKLEDSLLVKNEEMVPQKIQTPDRYKFMKADIESPDDKNKTEILSKSQYSFTKSPEKKIRDKIIRNRPRLPPRSPSISHKVPSSINNKYNYSSKDSRFERRRFDADKETVDSGKDNGSVRSFKTQLSNSSLKLITLNGKEQREFSDIFKINQLMAPEMSKFLIT